MGATWTSAILKMGNKVGTYIFQLILTSLNLHFHCFSSYSALCISEHQPSSHITQMDLTTFCS